jgi:hypothetical protein
LTLTLLGECEKKNGGTVCLVVCMIIEGEFYTLTNALSESIQGEIKFKQSLGDSGEGDEPYTENECMSSCKSILGFV